MTVDLHPDTVERARDRGGGPDPERPEHIGDVLDRPEVGHREGDPLVGDSYGNYPSEPSKLANPKWGAFVRDLLAHPLVDGYDTAVSELTGATDSGSLKRWRKALERAAGAYGVDAPELFDKGAEERQSGREDRLTAILGYEPPEGVVESDNPVLVATLYTQGLSVSEVCDVLGDRAEGQVREGQVRDTLKDVGLLGGSTRQEQREAFEDNHSRLGGVSLDFSESESHNPGVNINAEKVESDPNISVE